uniref:Uncharacterized protein n=1 Tax=Siphoviridae sp. cti6K1 TaxID=2825620 RepID=A0A8S5UAH4_9CAUD|nr:MAG TPA: hypothetical protein [Siphoviridae sp. cti6K1]DAY87773.1 MAG TPA: hypothetical protein [Caudoviricetes sp.]
MYNLTLCKSLDILMSQLSLTFTSSCMLYPFIIKSCMDVLSLPSEKLNPSPDSK